MTKNLSFYPKDHLSISALQCFRNCPFTFRMRYYLGVEPREKDRVSFGKQFQELLNTKYAGQDTDAKLEEFSGGNKGLAKLFLAKSYNFTDIISLDAPYSVDIGVGLPITYVPDVLTKNTIVENKTTTGYYNAKSILGEKQMTLYYMGVRKMLGIEPKLQYQIFNTKKKTVELLDTPRTKEDVYALVDWIVETLELIEKCYTTDNWATNDRHSFCDFEGLCPLDTK